MSVADDRVVEFLNDHLTAELTIINQYFLNSKMLESWGLAGLAKVFRDLSIEEMADAEKVIDRLLYLDAHPNMQRLSPIPIGENAKEIIELALQCEEGAAARLREGIETCTQAGDHGTREMAAEMLSEEEEHADFFGAQLAAIERVGLENYLAQYVRAD